MRPLESWDGCLCAQFEVVKVRLQVKEVSSSWLREFAHVVRSQGPSGLYGGLTALMLRDVKPLGVVGYAAVSVAV